MLGPGARVDRFIIERLLGRGGMAEVYAARDTQLRRLVALKRLLREDDAVSTARLVREARAAASFQHPGAVTVYDVLEHEGSPYMAMELVSGRTLREYIGDASIPAERRVRWLIDVARALAAAHRAGIIHRDVKPHNVMVNDEGAIKVLDFGIARARPKSSGLSEDSQSLGALTSPGAVLGTPLYASPEQLAAAAIDERSDQFAWGVMGYELCCGLLPWRRRDTLTMLAQLVAGDIPTMQQRLTDEVALLEEGPRRPTRNTPPPPPDPRLIADLPEEVQIVFRRAMEREPDDRYPSIDDAADDLEPFAEEPRSTRFLARAPAPESSSAAVAAKSAAVAPSDEHPDPRPTPGTRRTPRATPTSRTKPSSASSKAAVAPRPQPAANEPAPLAAAPAPLAAAPAPLPLPAPSDVALAPGGAEDRRPAPDKTPLPLWKRPGVRLGAFALLAAATVAIASALDSEAGSGRAPASTSAAPISAPAPAIARVRCAAAEIRGAEPAANAAAALGRGACVRLAIALGVPWEPSAGSEGDAPLTVTVDAAATTRVTLSLSGHTATADAPKPMPAVDAAARALAAQLSTGRIPTARETAFGAATPADALRIDAILRRHAARLAEDPAAELREASALAASAPWPRLYAMSASTAPEAERLREEVLRAADSLPPALAEAARGAVWLRVPKTESERSDALSALRRAYAARPEDGHVAAHLAEALLSAGLYEEAAAIGLRMADRAPDESLPALALLARGGPPDPTWIDLRGRLLDKLEALLPEARGWDARALHEAVAGRVAAARDGLAMGDALGLASASGRAWGRDLARASVEIADDRPAEARALVQPFLGSPSAAEAAEATRLLVQSYLLEGRIADAETALARDIARLEALGDQPRLAERWTTFLGIRRRLGMPPSDFADVRKLEAALPAVEARESPLAPLLRAEIFFVQLARKERAPSDAASVIDAIEAYARKVARGDRSRQDDLTMGAVPVAFVASGMSGVRALWKSLDHARFAATMPHLLLHGAASEQAGDTAEAERAYRAVATAPLVVDGLEHLAARFRLARLLSKSGHRGEAARWRDGAAKLLAGADKGVREALERDR